MQEYSFDNLSVVIEKGVKNFVKVEITIDDGTTITKNVKDMTEARRFLKSLVGTFLEQEQFDRMNFEFYSLKELILHYGPVTFMKILQEKIDEVLEERPNYFYNPAISRRPDLFFYLAITKMGLKEEIVNKLEGYMYKHLYNAYQIECTKRLRLYSLLANSGVRYGLIKEVVNKLEWELK